MKFHYIQKEILFLSMTVAKFPYGIVKFECNVVPLMWDNGTCQHKGNNGILLYYANEILLT